MRRSMIFPDLLALATTPAPADHGRRTTPRAGVGQKKPEGNLRRTTPPVIQKYPQPQYRPPQTRNQFKTPQYNPGDRKDPDNPPRTEVRKSGKAAYFPQDIENMDLYRLVAQASAASRSSRRTPGVRRTPKVRQERVCVVVRKKDGPGVDVECSTPTFRDVLPAPGAVAEYPGTPERDVPVREVNRPQQRR